MSKAGRKRKEANWDIQHQRQFAELYDDPQFGKLCAFCHDGVHHGCSGCGCKCPCQAAVAPQKPKPVKGEQTSLLDLPGVAQHIEE